MNETTFTLTPEATAVVKDTGGDINALASQSMYFGVAIIFALTLAMLGVLLTKVVTANGAGDLLKGKQGLFETLKVPFIFIVLFSFFSYLGLLKFDYKFGSSGTTAPTNLQGTPVKETDTTNNKPVTKNDMSFAQISANEADVRAVFARNGIKINAMACTSVGQSSCTTVGGMSSKTVDMLIKLKGTCQCDMTISGGTEWWSHSVNTKHRPGDKTAVDLRKDLYLTNFIKGGRQNGFEPALSWSTCYTAFTWNGFYFCDEKNTAAHWHVDPL